MIYPDSTHKWNANLQLKMLQVSLDTRQARPIHTEYRSRVGAGWSAVRSIVQYHDEFDRFYWSSESGLNIEFYSNETGYSFSQIEQEIRYLYKVMTLNSVLISFLRGRPH